MTLLHLLWSDFDCFLKFYPKLSKLSKASVSIVLIIHVTFHRADQNKC